MDNHAHGADGALLIANRNLTPHTSQMSFTPTMDTAEDTSLSPQGRAKTYLYGLIGSAASSSGFMVNDPDFIRAEMAHLLGTKTDTEQLTMAPFSFDAGNGVILARTFKTSYNEPNSLSSVVTTAINYLCGDDFYFGTSLWNPFGAAAYTASEVQTLVFSGVNENVFLGLRANGTSPLFPFQLSSYANDAAVKAGLKAGIEALTAYTGRTVTITGTLTKTSSAWSGTYTLTFDGDVNVPQLEARQGRVDHFVVSGGDSDSDYSANGGGTFSLGISAATFQTNQRALAGQFAAVVSKGTTTAPSGGPTTNVAAGKTVTGTGGLNDASISTLTDGTTGNASVALGYSSGATVTVDLATSQTINKITVWAGSGNNQPFSVSVLVSATGVFGGEEVTAGTISLASFSSDTATDVTFSGVSARYVRLLTTSGSSFVGSEILVYNTNAMAGVGSADIINYFPVAATPASPAATGTGATNTTTTAAGAAAGITPATTSDGTAAGQAIFNLVDSTGTGTWHDGAAELSGDNTTTTQGFYARFQALLYPGTALTVLIEHSDMTDGTGTSTLATFTITDHADLTQLVQEYLAASDTAVKRYVRAKVTAITGTFAFALCYARRS